MKPTFGLLASSYCFLTVETWIILSEAAKLLKP